MSQTRLASLTAEQRSSLPAYRALSPATLASRGQTTQHDLETAINELYSAAGLPFPERIVRFEGPLALARDWLATATAAAAGPNVRKSLLGLVDAARNTAFNSVTACIWETAERGTVNVRASTTSLAIRNAIVSEVERLRVGFSLDLKSWFGRGERRSAFRDSSWSYIDALDYNLAAYRYLGDAAALPLVTADMTPLWAVSTATSWIIPHAKTCWVAELPITLSTDANGRLHSGAGPALEYGDGLKVFAWKGIVVPEWVVTRPDLLTVRAIDRQANPWIRRCMIEIMTPERYVALGGASCVNRDGTGKLWRRQWWGPGDDSWAAVEVINGTAEPDGTFKRYYLQVPANVRTAREAVAWTYGLTDAQYENLVQRT